MGILELGGDWRGTVQGTRLEVRSRGPQLGRQRKMRVNVMMCGWCGHDGLAHRDKAKVRAGPVGSLSASLWVP